ncbi:MAG: diaminopimelate epimerase [Acidobacteria bacterium]|nr:diaminopimelate epimerase [Acidobacteriota bacterium]
MAALRLVKAHAYGNDFLFVPDADARADAAALARDLCERHEGIGADGLILFTLRDRGATMRLFNADGSPAELSGNGLRCLAAMVVRAQGLSGGTTVTVETGAGAKRLDLLARDGERYTFRADMGAAEGLHEVGIPVGTEAVTATVLRVGNPQCVVLGPLPEPDRFAWLGPALSTHPRFPEGTNVEFAQVESPRRVRILIWERGVGPTSSSGTGACAAAVAAAAHGGAAREVDVIAPGGIQTVEWIDDRVYLTGWAEILFEGEWLGV